MALVKAADVQKELYSAVEQLNTIIRNILSRIEEIEKQQEKPKRTTK